VATSESQVASLRQLLETSEAKEEESQQTHSSLHQELQKLQVYFLFP